MFPHFHCQCPCTTQPTGSAKGPSLGHCDEFRWVLHWGCLLTEGLFLLFILACGESWAAMADEGGQRVELDWDKEAERGYDTLKGQCDESSVHF